MRKHVTAVLPSAGRETNKAYNLPPTVISNICPKL